jgi:hypothetical protein
MAFPSDALGTVVQLKINNVWTNVVRYNTRTRILQKTGVTIKRGASGLQTHTPPGTCNWTWLDPDGVYNNENPRSPYFGVLPRNTPVRVYVPRSTSALYLIDRNDGSRGQTTDKAALDITGDIEIRVDFEPRRFTRWCSGQNRGMILASKYDEPSNRSWYIRFGETGVNGNVGYLAFVWSTTGANSIVANCTAMLPTTGRISIKVTMDIDNGAGSREVKFWTSTTGITGTYTQLGSTVTGGVTSIFSGAGNVELGTMDGGAAQDITTSNSVNYNGRIHAFRIYNSAGTLVANADYTAQPTGTTSFADGLGNTWTLGGTAEITNADYRFYGELSAPVQKPSLSSNGTGIDVKIEAEAGGILRRLGSNETPFQSPIFQTFSNYDSNGWWTGEEPATADVTLAGSGTSDGSPANITDITFEGFDGEIPGSAGVMKLGADATFGGICTGVTTVTGESHFYIFFKFPSVPVTDQRLVSWYNSGTIKRWDLIVTSGSYWLRAYDAAGTLVQTNNVLHGTSATPDRWIAYHSRQRQVGGNIESSHEWHVVNTDLYYTGPLTSSAGTLGVPLRIGMNPGAGCTDVRFCHAMASPKVGLEFFSGTPTANVVNFARAFSGETADSRFRRVCGLLGVEARVIGYPSLSQQMGPQPIDTGINILYECADVDGGIIIEANDSAALEFRPIRSLYNQYGMSLTYAQLAELESTPDDTDVANDIILNRAAGGVARATLAYGPMSIQAPPNGINPVPDGPTVNNYNTLQLPNLAGAMLVKRTWPTSRYPALKLEMHHPTFAANADRFLLAEKTEISDIIRVTSLPLFMAPDELALLVTGVAEELFSQEWSITYDLTPYGPYQTSENQTTPGGDLYSSWVAAHTTIAGVVQQQLNAGITSSATSIAVKTLSGVLFGTGAVNYRIKIGGEIMTVTNVSGAASPQTLTVTRGVVGGYSAAHNANDYVYIYPELLARL